MLKTLTMVSVLYYSLVYIVLCIYLFAYMYLGSLYAPVLLHIIHLYAPPEAH